MPIVFLALAGLVALVSDLGLGNEVAKYRNLIWCGLVVLSVLGVAAYELARVLLEVPVLRGRVADLQAELDESRLREESLLRLMERYKRDAYTDVLDNLNRLLVLATKRVEWSNDEARITQVRVTERSGAEALDPEFAAIERLDIVINIGKGSDVLEGMQFLVRDPSIPINYGLIAVRESYDDAAICSLVEFMDPAFWAEPLEVSRNREPRVVQVADNRIVPSLPSVLDNIEPEQAQELLDILAKIATSDQDVGGTL